MCNLHEYEHREKIATYRHGQSLLRSRLLNLNTAVMLMAVIGLLAFGAYEIVGVERAMLARVSAALVR